MTYDIGGVILIVAIAQFYATGHWIAATVLLILGGIVTKYK